MAASSEEMQKKLQLQYQAYRQRLHFQQLTASALCDLAELAESDRDIIQILHHPNTNISVLKELYANPYFPAKEYEAELIGISGDKEILKTLANIPLNAKEPEEEEFVLVAAPTETIKLAP